MHLHLSVMPAPSLLPSLPLCTLEENLANMQLAEQATWDHGYEGHGYEEQGYEGHGYEEQGYDSGLLMPAPPPDPSQMEGEFAKDQRYQMV